MSKHREIIPYNPKLKKLAWSLRKNLTLSEVLLWNKLKNYQMLGYDFDRQKPIDNYIVDFYCKDLKLVIEIDGITHSWEEVAVNDEIRQIKLESLGTTFLRFQDIDVKKKMPIVLEHISQWILENAPRIDDRYLEKYEKQKRL